MQNYNAKRVWAIVKESFNTFRQNKKLLLFSGGVFFSGLSIYIIAKQPTAAPSSLAQPFFEEEELLKLEDSISVTNLQLEKHAQAIDLQFKKRDRQVVVVPDRVSNRNKRLIISKIEAILKYLKTPLHHFNQLPTYFINNPALEQRVKEYNEQQLRLAASYARERKKDSSPFQVLGKVQRQLIEALNAEKNQLAQQLRQPKKRTQILPDSSEVLNALSNKRDSLTQVYSEQLARYQKQLDQLSAAQLSYLSSPSTFRQKETKDTVALGGTDFQWSDLFWLVALLVLMTLLPLLISVLKWLKFPFIKRLEDLNVPASKTSIKMDLNKNVNPELVAFNYEHLVEKVDRLAQNKHAVLACYSAMAEKQQLSIGSQLAILLAKLGNPVLHIQLADSSVEAPAAHQHSYTVSAFSKYVEIIQNRLITNAQHQLHQELYIVADEASLKKQSHLPSPLQYYWALQHFFASAKVREMLARFKKHFTYVVINTPDFSRLESSVLFIPCTSINVHVFKNEVSPLGSANRLCALNAEESLPAIHIIDYSRNNVHQILKK